MARYLKIPMLGFALFAVIYVMKQLESGLATPQIAAVLGTPVPQPQGLSSQVRHARLLDQLNWCETRVRELEYPGQFRLFQKGGQWLVEMKNSVREVNFISVEKWFARNCTLQIHTIAESEIPSFQPLLLVKFIRGPDQSLQADRSGHYKFGNHIFQSSQLDNAVVELTHLPAPSAPNRLPTQDGV